MTYDQAHVLCGCKRAAIHTCSLRGPCNRPDVERRDPNSRGASQRSVICGETYETCEDHCVACHGVRGCPVCDGTGLARNEVPHVQR